MTMPNESFEDIAAIWQKQRDQALEECERLRDENAKLRAVADAARAAVKSPGWVEHLAIDTALKALDGT